MTSDQERREKEEKEKAEACSKFPVGRLVWFIRHGYIHPEVLRVEAHSPTDYSFIHLAPEPVRSLLEYEKRSYTTRGQFYDKIWLYPEEKDRVIRHMRDQIESARNAYDELRHLIGLDEEARSYLETGKSPYGEADGRKCILCCDDSRLFKNPDNSDLFCSEHAEAMNRSIGRYQIPCDYHKDAIPDEPECAGSEDDDERVLPVHPQDGSSG